MAHSRILVIMSDATLARNVAEQLSSDVREVSVAATSAEVLLVLALKSPQLVLLDAQLRGHDSDGFAAIAELRDLGYAGPLIMLSDPRGVEHLTQAFQQGIDDYVLKPFALEELLARAAAVMRRHRAAEPVAEAVMTVGDAELDLNALTYRSATVGAVKLTPLEARLLEHLMRQAGLVVSRDTLNAAVWDPGLYANLDRVDAYVDRLRRKIEPEPAFPRYLLSAAEHGYVFQPDRASAPWASITPRCHVR